MTTAPVRKNSFLHGKWTIEDAVRLYGVTDWGKGYFGVSDAGHLTVLPKRNPSTAIDLYELVRGLRERDISTPVLIRFTDVLQHRLREIRAAFDKAIADQGYRGGYSCIYPIKVNQQRHVVEDIRAIARELGFGLEAGSKPELLAVLGLTDGDAKMPIVCNGFKDDEFIETVILAAKLGRNIIPVVEKFSDLERIVRYAEKYQVRPQVGVRVKLSARGAGRWVGSAGARSKFGLTIAEVIEAVDFLKGRDMLDCLRMVHCHVGSQVHEIRRLKNAINELTHIYAELCRLGAPMGIIDVGGGLGVDYDGSQSAWESSVNYTVEEYAADVVYRVQAVCDEAGVPHPMILSESGRAMTAYSSVLVMDVLGASRFEAAPDMDEIRRWMAAEDEVPQPVLDLIDAFERLGDRNLLEVYHDSIQARDEAMSLFSLGYISLRMRAASERLFWAIGQRVQERATARGDVPEELEELPELLSDIYFCNFSLFQSMPDAWAIDQLFPICPIHRLSEPPTRQGVLADLTCDSDGKVDRFVSKRDDKRILELHELREGEPYYLGVFLLGAYQEILGDLHNLFGDTHAVHISVDDEGRWSVDEFVEGDTVEEVLRYVQFDTEELTRSIRRDVERAVKNGRLHVAEGRTLMNFYESGLKGYTYLE